jgi:hypothetical protein
VGKGLESIICNNHKPFIFTHSDDGKFYVISQKDSANSGWVQKNLMKSFENSTLTSFNVYQNFSSRKIKLSVATIDGNNQNKLYTTNLLDPELFINDNYLSSNDIWQEIVIKNKDETINNILLDNDSLFITTKKEGQDAKYYQIDENNKCHNVIEYQLPENGSDIQDIKLGNWEGERGLFLLYQIGENQTLLFQSFPDPEYGKTFKRRFDVGDNKLSSIAIIKNANSDDHDLYTAGQGVFCFKVDEDRYDVIPRRQEEKEFFIENLRISQFESTISCWFTLKGLIGDNKSLFYMYNEPSEEKWSVPTILKDNVKQFCCVRSKDIRNHLFYTDNSKKLNHLFEDEVSTLWYNNFVPTQGLGTFKEAMAYLTEVKFDDIIDKNTQIKPNSTITISSPINLYITVEDALYQVGPNYSVEIPYSGGNLFISHIINEGFVDAVLCLKADFLSESLAIDMAESIYNRIKNLTRESLKNLIPEKYSDDKTLDGVIQILQYMIRFREDCMGNQVCGINNISSSSNEMLDSEDITSKQEILSASISKEGWDAIISASGGIIAGGGVLGLIGIAALAPKDPASYVVGCVIAVIIGLFLLFHKEVISLFETIIEEIIELTKKRKPKIPEKKCPSFVFNRVDCKGSMTIYDDKCNKTEVDITVHHMFACINMILTFIGIKPSDIVKWETDNDNCIYRGLLY